MPKSAASDYSENDKSPFDRCVAKVYKKLKGRDPKYPGQTKLQRAKAICAATMRRAHPEEFAAAQEQGRKAAAKKSAKTAPKRAGKKAAPKKTAVKKSAAKAPKRSGSKPSSAYKAAMRRLRAL